MPTWTHDPPDDPRGYGLPIIRTPAARDLRAIVTSADIVGCDTHFWGGHTVPCERPDCEACNHGIRYDWHGYLTAFNPADELHFIFEMTTQAAKHFTAFKKEHGTLRCAQFRAYRWGKKPNGRVCIKIELSACPSHSLPDPPNIENVMAIIWRLPGPNVTLSGVQRNVTRIWAHSEGDGQSSDPKDYAELSPGPNGPPAA